MKRGEVWWANIPQPIGRRPVLLLSRNAAYPVRSSVTVAPITRTVHEIPVEVRLGPEDGLPRDCVANLDNIVTVSKKRLDRSLTTLSPEKMRSIEQAIKFALDLR
ncbi:MAG TPA: type II toxin-antitoxin system PemK/MazF family toxin [Terriglobia bacterium]|jgi:mRNA interferase MazF|nr:type II toxin-antitoxin system PemK/MazF family toxin [Terriglobia bacterium]